MILPKKMSIDFQLLNVIHFQLSLGQSTLAFCTLSLHSLPVLIAWPTPFAMFYASVKAASLPKCTRVRRKKSLIEIWSWAQKNLYFLIN